MLIRCVTIASIFLASSFAQPGGDSKDVIRLIQKFCLITISSEADAKTRLLADNYVHITEDGAMTTSWRIVRDRKVAWITDRLTVRTFGDVAVANYRWHTAEAPTKMTNVAQVFQKRTKSWRIIATQVGGLDSPLPGPITAVSIVPPSTPPEVAREIRETWVRQLLAADLKTPAGDHAEDLDTIRSIFAEDAMYVNPDGSVLSREQVLARGHPNTTQLTGKQVADAIAANSLFHIDERFVAFGNAVVWTSRNRKNKDQSLRVYLKRPGGWQMIFVHHGMSFR